VGSETCVLRWHKDGITRRYLEWINEADAEEKKAEIFLLADVAGSGKSAIAHAVAQRSHNHGLLRHHSSLTETFQKEEYLSSLQHHRARSHYFDQRCGGTHQSHPCEGS
jgi:hypothetical protein